MRQRSLRALVFLILAAGAVCGQKLPANELLRELIDLPAPVFPAAPNKNVVKMTEHPPEFFNDDAPPPDDAPIEDLVEYWSRFSSAIFPTFYHPEPSAKTIDRLLEYCEKNPGETNRLLGMFPPKPEIAEVIDRIFEALEDEGSKYQIREWLRFNSKKRIAGLIEEANNVRDEENYVQNPNQHVLRGLARLDWDAALPIVTRLENDPTNPYSQVLAKWVTYQHARDTGDSSTESTYRRDLQKIVENTQAPWALRDLAMDALVIVGDFEGRDEWYVSLLEDETLLKIQENGNTGLSTLIQLSPRKKWKAKMIELTKSANITVRSTAARNLVDSLDSRGDPEVLKALMPWLDNADWVKASNRSERMILIKRFAITLLPEAVPSLIAIVSNEPGFRHAAAMALGKYKDARAIPVLRNALAAEETHVGRNIFIGAIVDSGGLSDDEQMAALETFASLAASPEERKKFETFVSTYRGRIGEIVLDDEEYDEEEITGDEAESGPKVPAPPLQVSIGAFVAGIEEPGEGLVTRAAERLKALWRTNPAVAAELAAIMLKWKGPAMYAETLRRIRTDEGSIDDILNALTNRQEISEKVPGALTEMRGAGGVSRAIGACIAEDHLTVLSILAGNETDAQIAMLGCTRMLRAGLPVNEVGELLGSSNELLAVAAERYLESDDSLEARTLILTGKKNEAAILGARTAFIPDPTRVRNSEALVKFFESFGQPVNPPLERLFKNKESELQKELLEDPDMIAVYAMLRDQESGRTVVRIYKNKATFTFYEDAARYWEKPLTAEDCKALRDLLVEKKIDSLKPIRTCISDCQPNEFIMFGRDGGRRVFFRAFQPPAPLDAIDNAFKAFRQADDIKLRYRLADTTPGLEVLWTDPKLPARAVWSGNGEVRLLTEDLDKGAENSASFLREVEALRKSTEGSDESAFRSRIEEMQRRAVEAKEAHFAWRKLENGRAADIVPQPPETPYLYDHTQAPEMPYIRSTPRGWQVRADASEIRAGEYYEPGLYRTSRTEKPFKFKEGFYQEPIVSRDGRWVVAVKQEEGPKAWNGIVRINLQTGREFKIKMEPAVTYTPITFVGSHNKILVYTGPRRFPRHFPPGGPPRPDGETVQPTPEPSAYYLVDPATGTAQQVNGELRPLEDQTYRPLQATAVKGEYWAAIYDEKSKTTNIGRYNDKTFSFKAVLNLPGIELDSMAIWADESVGKVYFVYEGHLLSVPITKIP